MKEIEKIKIRKIENEESLVTYDDVIAENFFEIYENNEVISRLRISPMDIENLVVGNLFSLGKIQSIDDIDRLEIGESKAFVKIKENKSPRNKEDPGKFILPRERIFALSKNFQERSEIFKKTGGAHSAGLIENFEIIDFKEDVARSNAVDKLIGSILKNEVDIFNKFIFLSCRISDQIVEKILRTDFNLIISQSAPTTIAIKKAIENNINLIGFARRNRFNIYNQNENLEIR